jgi:hypothetical protein
MFLQYIAGIHFTDSEEPFFSAVYTLSSPRTVICLCSKYSQIHITVFSIPSHRFDCASIEESVTRKNKKKESKVLLSGKCADNIMPFRVFQKKFCGAKI